MPRHYLKISKRLRPYAAKVASLDEDWRQMIFNDLTHSGRELHIVHVAPNEQGPLIGLCGEKFFCHAGQDKHNAYSLFISRITPSAYRGSKEPPTRIVGEYELITEADWDPPPKDPVKPLFQQALAANSTEATRVHPGNHGASATPDPEAGERSLPSEALLQVLEGGGSQLRNLWSQVPAAIWPALGAEPADDKSVGGESANGKSVGGEPANDDAGADPSGEINGRVTDNEKGIDPGTALLATLKGLWNRYRIEEYAELEPRPLALLKGTITPSQVSAADCRDMAAAFGIDTLNTMVSVHNQSAIAAPAWDAEVSSERADVLGLVRDLAPVPLDPSVRDEIADAVMHATSRILVRGEGRIVVQRWLVRQCGVTPQGLARQRDELQTAMRDWLHHESQMDTDLLSFVRRLDRLDRRVAEVREGLPDKEVIEQRKREAERAYVRAMDVLRELTVPLLEHEPELSADALIELTEIFAQDARLAALPPWLWSETVTYEAQVASSERMAWCYKLTDSTQRARIKRACQLLDSFDKRLYELLSRYPAPPDDVTPEAHFLRAVKQLEPLADNLASIDESHLGWVRHALDCGFPTGRITGVVKALDSISERLDESVLAQLIRDLEDVVTMERNPDAAEHRMVGYVGAIEQIEALFGNAHDATWSQIERLMGVPAPSDSGSSDSPSKSTSTGPLLRFDHNWVDETGRRVPLVLVPHDDRERAYGVIRVPLTVRTPAPRDVACELEVEISSSLHQNWPDGWERPSPRALRISADAWRESGDEAIYTFTLTIPLRLPKSGKESVDIEVRALDSKSGWPISERKRLRWSRISVWKGDIPFSWPDTVQTEYVRSHPIGPQRRFEDIVHRLGQGGSFAVIAPRRFGKTTLVEYLHEQGTERGLAIPLPIVCTGVIGEYGVDYQALWRQVSAGLQELLGVGLRLPTGAPAALAAQTGDRADAALPPADAFQDVRERAKERGLSAVAVLIDEAQLLFPRHGGDRLGNALKDRLERYWSRDDLPPVAFGFIGLPGLRERAGANLMGILRPYEGRHVEERALNRLILQVTKERLSTTREARQRLAAQTGNLYMLKTLLDRLVSHINRERRNWAAFQDVRLVEAELRAELEAGESGNLTQYMRDPLNRSEDINIWDPFACYPVALAVAASSADMPDASAGEHLEAAGQLCDTWCRQASQKTGNRLTFPKKRMEEHMATLRDIGLWDGTRFVSGIVRSWLIGVADTFPRTDSDRRVLIRAALPRIRIPVEGEQVHLQAPADSDAEGGGKRRHRPGVQLYRHVRDGQDHALIQVPIADEAVRQRFVKRVDALQIVKEQRRRGEPGSEYLCPVIDAGLADGSEHGVTIHRWVDGMTLDGARGRLDTPLVVTLGSKLAQALDLLHGHDVVHEHIIPAHIVIERATARPVFVDFGLTRIAQAVHDKVAHDGADHDQGGASESRRSPDLLNKPADIQALGATLNALWDRERADDKDRAALDPLLSACADKRPGERPEAHEFVQRLDDIAETLGVYRQNEATWQEIRDIAEPDMGKRWFREYLLGFRPALVAIRQGLHHGAFTRGCELAVFLARLEHGRSHARANGRPDARPNGRGDTETALGTLHALSDLLTRATPTLDPERVARELDIPDTPSLHALLAQGSRELAEAASLASLPRVIQLLSRDRA